MSKNKQVWNSLSAQECSMSYESAESCWYISSHFIFIENGLKNYILSVAFKYQGMVRISKDPIPWSEDLFYLGRSVVD